MSRLVMNNNENEEEEISCRQCCHAVFCCPPKRFDAAMFIALSVLLGPVIYFFVIASPDINEHTCLVKSWSLIGAGILLVGLILISCWRSCVGFYHEKNDDEKKKIGTKRVTCQCGQVNYAYDEELTTV